MRTLAKLFRRRMRRLGVLVTWAQAREHAIWTRAATQRGGSATGRQFKMPAHYIDRVAP